MTNKDVIKDTKHEFSNKIFEFKYGGL